MSNAKLIEAVKSGDSASVRNLIASGEDVHQRDDYGWTPLNWAAGRGDLEIVKVLVDAKTDILATGRDQRTPYMIALSAGHVEVVKFLKAVEEKSGKAASREPRKYCKAYYMRDVRQFPQFIETRKNWKQIHAGSHDGKSENDAFSDDDVIFIHQDFTVTESMWHNENVIFDQVTPEWSQFCENSLGFKVPDDLDLIVEAKAAAATES